MSGGPVAVYLDVYALVNFVLDGLLLWAAGRLAGETVRPGRLAAGAAAGALYAVMFVLVSLPALFSWPAAAAVSLLMVYLTYRVPPSRLIRLVVWYYAAGFVVAGAAVAASSLATGGLQWWARGFLPASALVLGLGLTAVLVRAAARLWAERRLGPVFVDADVCLGGRRCTVRALVDSGNQLRDPHSHLPVMVVELAALKELLPGTWYPAGKQAATAGDLLAAAAGGRPFPVRLVPYRTLGRSGLLLGFRPDFVSVTVHGGPRVINDIVIGLYDQPLSPDGSYAALLPAAVTQGS